MKSWLFYPKAQKMYYNDSAQIMRQEERKKRLAREYVPFLPFRGKSDKAKNENKNLLIVLRPKGFPSL